MTAPVVAGLTGHHMSIADSGYVYEKCVGVADRGLNDWCGNSGNSGWFPGYAHAMRVGSWFGLGLGLGLDTLAGDLPDLGDVVGRDAGPGLPRSTTWAAGWRLRSGRSRRPGWPTCSSTRRCSFVRCGVPVEHPCGSGVHVVTGQRLSSGSRKSTCDAGDQFGELPTVDRDDSSVRAASNLGEHDLRDGGIRLPFDELRYKRSEVG